MSRFVRLPPSLDLPWRTRAHPNETVRGLGTPGADLPPMSAYPRWITFTTSASLWPLLVLALPAAITFASTEVFAEAGAPSEPRCEDRDIDSCEGRVELAACDGGGAWEYACQSVKCKESSGESRTVRACEPIVTCARFDTAPCEGKARGDGCFTEDRQYGGSVEGSCDFVPGGCRRLNDSGAYAGEQVLECAYRPTPAPDRGEAGASGTTSDANGPSSSSDSSGCSTSPSGSGWSALLGAPLALALLALRRRGSRSA